jgi:hypothetical protein
MDSPARSARLAPMPCVIDANELNEVSIFVFQKSIVFLGGDRITSDGNFSYASDGWHSRDLAPTDPPSTTAAVLHSS